MYIHENAVLQRELLINLRMTRAFVLLFCYVGLLGLVVYTAWPNDLQLDLSVDSVKAQGLVNMFFLGQFVLASLMAPSFAAGSITGEKERKTYEMLLASPMLPSAIVLGKLLASLCFLALLIFASLPIVMLCIPLGGISAPEVLTAYFALICAVLTFGMMSIACSSFFSRTAASLVVSYLLILPLALLCVVLWNALSASGEYRLILTWLLIPILALVICSLLFRATCQRLLHPPDVGSEGKDVVDLDEESKQVVGMLIQSDQFPDKLFAPSKRTDLMEDGTNPVFDKEMRSELFSQGTLMLRLVIQVSMFLAIPLMAFFLYLFPANAPWYVAYVVLFNMLVGPVFSADRVTGERERQTLDLLLTTLVTPSQILWGKLISGLRVSSVLTMFLVWPLFLACFLVVDYWRNLGTMAGYLVIIAMTCLTTATIALFCSVNFRKTSTSMMAAYLVILILFLAPLAANFFAQQFFPDTASAAVVNIAQMSSPVGAAFALPLSLEPNAGGVPRDGEPALFAGHLLFSSLLNLLALSTMVWLFNMRWRVSQSE